MPDLTLGMRSRSPGDRVDLTVARGDGSRTTLVLTLDEAPLSQP
jgi:S1-C subfamily serine protease